MEYNVRLKELQLEIERLKHQKDDKKYDSLPFKVKLQTFNHQGNEDILTFLAEFEAVASHAKWGEKMKTLQLRTLLTGEAREVAQETSETYDELRKALINRFGKRPHEYFNQLSSEGMLTRHTEV
ncbi:hypothetical protein ACJMK2_014203 [Sinanodonta woodiana]|uniref:Retrotransposon gag domain-containing protein n=1 Tax=Sinanodonta woodiana TaxID=1069815 RepID=A0ABD3V304_SINWO